MYGAEIAVTYFLIKFLPYSLIFILKVIASRIGMTCVNAYPNAGFVIHAVYNTLNLPECKSYV